MMKSDFATCAGRTNFRAMLTPRPNRWMPVAALAGLASCLALAADNPADAVGKMRQEWRAQVEKDTKKAREDYAGRLEKLEKELAAAGDYAGAGHARRERRRITGETGGGGNGQTASPPAVTDGQPVVLEMAAAKLSGGIVFDAVAGILRSWSGTGAASWLLPPGLKAGGYEVELTWSCAPDAGGDLVIKEDRHSLRRAVTPSASWDDYQSEVVGTLRLLANCRLLEFTAAAVKGGGLLQLKSIRLLPANAGK